MASLSTLLTAHAVQAASIGPPGYLTGPGVGMG